MLFLLPASLEEQTEVRQHFPVPPKCSPNLLLTLSSLFPTDIKSADPIQFHSVIFFVLPFQRMLLCFVPFVAEGRAPHLRLSGSEKAGHTWELGKKVLWRSSKTGAGGAPPVTVREIPASLAPGHALCALTQPRALPGIQKSTCQSLAVPQQLPLPALRCPSCLHPDRLCPSSQIQFQAPFSPASLKPATSDPVLLQAGHPATCAGLRIQAPSPASPSHQGGDGRGTWSGGGDSPGRGISAVSTGRVGESGGDWD